MDNKRIAWIDVARGIGIILVIYGHALSGDSYRHLIYSFHMPLFFFLSGIVHHHKKEESFIKFFNKTFKRIMVPYFLFAALTYLVWFVTLRKDDASSINYLQQLIGVFYGNSKFLAFNTLLWFLPCLFITKVGFELVTRISAKKYFIGASLIIFSIIGYLGSIYFPKLKMYWGLETALTAIVFFGTGYLWYQFKDTLLPFMKKNLLPALVLSAFLWLIVAECTFQLYGSQIDMRMNRFNNYFLFYLGSYLGISMTLFISMLINTNVVLEYLGKKSLTLFIWHYFVLLYIMQFLDTYLPNQFLHDYRNYFLAPVYTIIAIVFIVATDYLVTRIAKIISPTFDRKSSSH